MMLQLSTPIWVNTPLGDGHALLIMDYGVSINTVWVVHLFDGGRVVHVDSSEVRVMGNPMYGIEHPPEPKRKSLRPAK